MAILSPVGLQGVEYRGIEYIGFEYIGFEYTGIDSEIGELRLLISFDIIFVRLLPSASIMYMTSIPFLLAGRKSISPGYHPIMLLIDNLLPSGLQKAWGGIKFLRSGAALTDLARSRMAGLTIDEIEVILSIRM
ncbi:MAG TPA: hypothetical protein VIO58_05625 [Candidatus Methanoperedens sp.]